MNIFSLLPARILIVGMVSWTGLAAVAEEPPADSWRSELYDETWSPPGLEKDFYSDKIIQDFSHAGYRLGAPVPRINAPGFGVKLFDVTQPPYSADPSGATDSTLAIQQALTEAGNSGGGVVYLPGGTYRVSILSGNSALVINHSNVILRGAGVGETFLYNTTYDRRGGRIISVTQSGGWKNDRNPTVLITRDLMGPTRVIQVASTLPFAVGNWIVIRTDTTVHWVDEHQEPDWRPHAGTGNLTGLSYKRQILAIDREANTLLIDAPTRYAVKTRDRARVHPADGAISEFGLEDFSIGNLEHPGTESSQWSSLSYQNPDHHAWSVHGNAAISIANARNGWVRNVHSFRPSANGRNTHILSNGLTMSFVRSVTVENVRMERPLYGGGGGNGYMFRMTNSSEVLVRDSLAAYNRHGFVYSSMASTGNVILDSEDRFTNRQAATTGNAGGANSDHHMFFSHSNLVDRGRVRDSMFEARYRPFTASPRHNITAAHSVFWNTMGLGPGTNAVHSDQARYGYVIGTRGLDGSSRFGVILGDGTRPQTLPTDHVEGIGDGANLYPGSLYLHQLDRRETGIQPEFLRNDPAVFPGNAARLRGAATIGRRVGAGQGNLTFAWTLVDGPGAAVFTDPASPATRLLMERPGVYRVRLTVTGGDAEGVREDEVRFHGPARDEPEPEVFEFSPTDDTHVQSSNALANFGGNTTLWVKALGNTNERQAYLRFDLSGVEMDPGRIRDAALFLQKTNETTPHDGALFRGTDHNWSEGTMTYINKPVADIPVTTWSGNGSPGPLKLEVGGAVSAALTDGGLLTLRLGITRQTDSGPIMRYASKEYENQNQRPVLRVSAVPAPLFYDAWVAENGIPAERAGRHFDHFGGGLPNLVTYLTGGGTFAERPRLFVEDGVMRVTLPWRRDLGETSGFSLQVSENLLDWELAETSDWSAEDLDDDRVLWSGRSQEKATVGDRRFFRLTFFGD